MTMGTEALPVHAEVCDAARYACGDCPQSVQALPQVRAQPH